MPLESTRKYNPPYISPLSFRRLLETLQKNMPGRFDRSFLDTMYSGSAGIQVMAALRFMNLADANNQPTPRLRQLVGAQGEEHQRKLRDICTTSYSAIFADIQFNLLTATPQQLEEKFTECYRVDGDVRRKCIKFFTSLAADSGIRLSDFITQKVRTSAPRGNARSAVKKPAPKAIKPAATEAVKMPPPPADQSLLDKLLGKFPDFDHNWSAEEKKQWLEAFMLFMQKIYPDEKQ